MSSLDWWVIGAYLLAMLGLAAWLGRRQGSREDYYLGGRNLPGWALATSIIATQCSTNSLLGAPAFVGFVIGGGMLWLQYELAVPLAMLGLCVLFAPVHRSGVISIYAFLEQRLGLPVRLLASGCFLFFRGVATAVTVYGVASVIALITGLPYLWAVCLLMGITVTYDVLGGMRAVVISDVVQMVLLLAAVLLALLWLAPALSQHLPDLAARAKPLANDWGLDSGSPYGFWPMLFGGLFLYMAYYGCDQSQAQRLLSARDGHSLNQVLLLNGLLRFPLVGAYCLLGLGLAAYALNQPDFVPSLPQTASGEPNFNLVFPSYVAREFSPGLAGLAIVGLFAAAMSSIDSALNSLSASTLEDFIVRFRPLEERSLFLLSKLSTLAWGLFAIGFSFAVEHIAPTVLEAINKIGSMANGPLLALFITALLFPAAGTRFSVGAFACGLLGNALLWLFAPGVSWLWWNVWGLLITLLLTAAAAQLRRGRAPHAHAILREQLRLPPRPVVRILGGMFLAIICLLVLMQWHFGR